MHEQKKPPFPQNKNVSFTENLPKRSQKRRSSANQTLFIYTSLSLLPIQKNPFPPSIFHSHPAISYCPPKNTAILLSFALTPYAVTPERRTDSKPFRRRLVRKNGFGSCRRKLLQNYFRQSFESSPESRGSQTSGVLLVLFVQAKRINPSPLQGAFEASLPPTADILVAFATIVCRFAAFPGASGRRLLPVHTKRVRCLLRKQTKRSRSRDFSASASLVL